MTNRNAAAFRARRAGKTRNFRFRRQLGSEVGRFGVLPAAPGRLYCRPRMQRTAPGERLGFARGDRRALRGAPGTSLGRLERVPRSMLGDSGSMLRRFWVRFSSLFEVASRERVDVRRVRNDERQRERLDLAGSIGQRLNKLARFGNDHSIWLSTTAPGSVRCKLHCWTYPQSLPATIEWQHRWWTSPPWLESNLYINPDRRSGAWDRAGCPEIPKTGPRTHFEPVPEPIQGQLDVQGHPTPPFQSQLDVQRLLEPPFQGQPDVQGSLKPSHFRCFLRFQRDPQRKGPNPCFC